MSQPSSVEIAVILTVPFECANPACQFVMGNYVVLRNGVIAILMGASPQDQGRGWCPKCGKQYHFCVNEQNRDEVEAHYHQRKQKGYQKWEDTIIPVFDFPPEPGCNGGGNVVK